MFITIFAGSLSLSCVEPKDEGTRENKIQFRREQLPIGMSEGVNESLTDEDDDDVASSASRTQLSMSKARTSTEHPPQAFVLSAIHRRCKTCGRQCATDRGPLLRACRA